MSIQVSLFASAVRPKLWYPLVESLKGTSVEYEIVFCGNATGLDRMEFPDDFIYIPTENIKPAQCYEIARRHCKGEVVVWVADDCEFPGNVIGKAYDYWKSQNNEKLILSIQTKESGYNYPSGELLDMNIHRFFGYDSASPLMAPLGMINRKFLDELGGIDNRYICGQYENDIVMRAYQNGGTVEIFGGKDAYIDIDHLKKSIDIGESTNKEDFLNRPFASGFESDRKVLENSWCRFNQDKLMRIASTGKQVVKSDMFDIFDKQLDKFQPYSTPISLDKSEGNNLTDRWL